MILSYYFLLLLFLIAKPPIAVVDEIGHFSRLSGVLNQPDIEYTFYPVTNADFANALRQARNDGGRVILFPWVLRANYPDIYEELRQSHEAGIKVFVAAGDIENGHTIDLYDPVATVVGAVDDNGNPVPGLYYGPEVEQYEDGCTDGICSTSVAATRAAIKQYKR